MIYFYSFSSQGRYLYWFLAFVFCISLLATPSVVRAQTQTINTTNSDVVPEDPNCATTLTRTFSVTGTGVVTDLNLGLNLTHAYRGDLRIQLRSPQGIVVTVIEASGDDNANYDLLLDDNSANPINDGTDDAVASPIYGADRTVRPSNVLSAFNGQNASGVWTLIVCDAVAQDIGSFNSAQLVVTTSPGSGSDCSAFSILALNYNANNFTRYNGLTGVYLNTISGSGVLSGPNSCLQLADGSILIVNGNGDNVTRYNPYTGANLGTFIAAGAGGIDFPEQIKFGPDGNLYVTSQSSNRVVKFDRATGAVLATFTDANLNAAHGSGFIGSDMYISQNLGGGKINRYNPNTGAFLSTLYTYPSNEAPRGMDVKDGNLYVNVVTSTGARVDRITPAGVRTTFATLDANSSPFAGIKWGPDNKLYIADYGESEVHRFTVDGNPDITFTSNMNGPHFVAFVGCTPLSVNLAVTQPLCGSNNGSITVTPSGGVIVPNGATYTYRWSNGATTQNLSNLGPGSYTVTVTDANSVTFSASATLTNANPNCERIAMTVTPSICSTLTNQYSVTGTVSLVNAVAGSLTITDANRSTIVPIAAGQTAATYALTGLQSGTGSHTVTLSYVGKPITQVYSAPASCTVAATISVNNTAVCAGQTATLSASGCVPGTITWSAGVVPPSGSRTVTVSTATLTGITSPTVLTYTATCTIGFSVTSAVASVTVNPNPSPTINSPVICVGQTASLTATGGNSYTLLNTNTVNTTGIFPVSPTNTTAYTVLVRNATNCTAPVAGTVTVNALPTATLSSTAICAGQPATLTASGGGVYNFGSGNTSNNTLIVNPSQTTTYSVIVTNAAGCTATATGSVTVNALPTPILTSAVICAGRSTTLTASEGSGLPGTLFNFGSGFSTTNTLVVSPAVTTPYTVTVTNAAGCTATAMGSVTVNALPTATLTSTAICAGQSATLTASGGSLYNFGSGNQPVGILIINPTQTTTYSVVITNAAGCTATAMGSVTVNALPTPTLTNTAICAGQSVLLTAGGGLPGSLYNFGFGATTTNTLLVSPAATTPYTVTVTSAAGCTATATGSVTVNALPTVTFTSVAICAGQSATLTASGGSLYNFGSGNQPVGILIVSPTQTTTYSVVVTNATGCTATTTGTVTVNTLPVPTLSSTVVCAGQSVTLTASGGTGGPFSYSFSNGTVNTTGLLVLSPAQTGVYTVTVSNGAGCRATTTGSVTVNALPIPTLSSATICDGQSATLLASGGSTGGPFTYEFSGNINNTSGQFIVNPSNTVTYSVVVTTAQLCSASATGTVTVNPVPTITVSPNNPVACLGSSTTLVVNGCTGSVRWTNNQDATVYTTPTVIITPTVNTTYTVTCTTPQNCTTVAQSFVTVAQPGSVSAINYGPACPGSTILLAASGSGSVYRWSGPNNFTANTSTFSLSGVTPANAGLYSVTVSGGQCAGVGSTSVTINPAVTATLTSSSICDGESTTLVATGGSTYEFTGNNTNNTGRLVVSPSVSTVYSVTVTNAQGCVGTATGTVTLRPSVTATLTSSTICAGQSATLTASGGAGGSGTLYNFGSGNTPDAILIVSPTSSTPYSVVITNGQGCTAVALATVTVNVLPAATITSTAICAGQSATLTASGGSGGGPFSYSFSNGTVNNTGLLAVTPAATTSYSVLVSTAQGCTASAVGSITVNSLPTPTLSSSVICAGQSVTLTASGGTGLTGTLYNFGNGPTTTNQLVVSPASTSTYTVVVTNVSGCTASATGSVTVNALPSPTLSGMAICVGQSATLVALGGPGSGILYNFGSGNSATSTLVVSPTVTTPYTVTVTNPAGCTATATGSVTVNALPTPTLTGAVICVGESVTLTASGGAGLSGLLYNFGTGNTPDGRLIVNPTATTTYTVIVTNATGCTASTTGSVVVNTLPTATLSSATICAGQSATLTAQDGSGPSGSLYNFGSGNQPVGQLVINPGTPTTYSVVVTNTAGCTASATGTVLVNPLPTPTLSSAVICAGQSATLTASGGSSQPGTLYNFGTGNSVNNNLIVNPSQNTTYSVTVTNGAGCTATATGSVTVNALPTPTLSSATICAGQSATLTATDGAGLPGTLYNFGNGATAANTRLVSPAATTTYTVIVTNAAGCTASATATVTVNDVPQPALSNATICAGESVTLTASGGVEYDFGSGLTPVNTLVVSPSATTIYTVMAASPVGCTASATGRVTVNTQPTIGITSVSCVGLTTYTVNFTATSGALVTTSLGIVSANQVVSIPTGQTVVLTVTLGDCTFSTATSADCQRNAATLGDFVWEDQNRDGQQQPGEPGILNVVVTLISNGSVVATTTTNENGFYSFTGLTPGVPYSVSFTAPANYSASPANQGGNDETDSDALNGLTRIVTLGPGENNPRLDAGFYALRFDLSLNKAILNAPSPLLPGSLITYRITVINQGEITALNTQITDTPPAGLSFSAPDSPGFTSNGSVSTAVVASLAPGQSVTLAIAYTLQTSTTAALTNRAEISDDSGDDIDSTPGNSTTTTDEDDTAAATIQPVQFAALGDFVWEDRNANGQQDTGEPGIENVTVSLVLNNSVVATTQTNANGLYSFTGLTPGVAYQVEFGRPAGFAATTANVGNDATDSDRDPLTGRSQSVTMAGGETNNTLDAGFYRPATLGDQTFVDTNGDGQHNNDEPPFANVTVTLICNGSAIATTTTDADGLYSFTGLTPGVPYSVGFTTPRNGGPSDYSATTYPTGTSNSITLSSGETNNTLDAGFIPLKPNLILTKQVSAAKARFGDVVSYTVTVANTGPVAATNVVVDDTFSSGLAFIASSASVSVGSFTPGLTGGTWAIASLPVGTTASLTFSASLLAEGILYNTASLPDQTVQVCTSVPFRICEGTVDFAILASAPFGYNRYQWLYTAPGATTATVVADGTLNSYTATQLGEYSVLVDDGINGLCAQASCCPVLIEATAVPSFTVVVQNPGCLGNQPQTNGGLTLIGLGGNPGDLYDYQYTAGTSFDPASALPASATAVPANGVLATLLADGNYTVRITDRQTGCIRDVTVALVSNCSCPAEICTPVIIRKTRTLR